MTDEERKRREEQLIARLLLLFADYQSQWGTMPDAQLVQAFERDAAQRIAPLLAGTFESGAQGLAAQAGVNVAARQAAQRWANAYAGSLATELANTTRDRLAQAGQMATEERQDAIDDIFGQQRAESIGITETTRSDTLGQQYGAEDIAEQGVQLFQIWRTERDGIVCSRCASLDGVHEEYWGQVEENAVAGPPLHPYCRCNIIWVDSQGRKPRPPDDEVQLPARPNKPRPSSNPFEMQPVGERETQTATLDLQGQPQGARQSGQPLDLDFTIPGKVHAKHGSRRLVTVSVAKLETAWSQSQPAQYISDSGKGADPDKLRQANQFLRDAEKQGIPVEASVVDLNRQTGAVFVSDGRHRLATLRDMGFSEVQIAVPRQQVKAFEEMFGPTPGELPKSLSRDEVLYRTWWTGLLKDAGDNCGTGHGGFKPGNTCGDEDGVESEESGDEDDGEDAEDDTPKDTVDTASPEFKEWFSGSVVSEGGEPLKVYHASSSQFDEFSADEGGGWAFFATDREYADNYGENHAEVYLAIKKPVDLRGFSGSDDVDPEAVSAALADHGINIPAKDLGDGEIHQVLYPARKEIAEQALANGYDGLRQWENFDGQEAESIVAFVTMEKKQIKINRWLERGKSLLAGFATLLKWATNQTLRSEDWLNAVRVGPKVSTVSVKVVPAAVPVVPAAVPGRPINKN